MITLKTLAQATEQEVFDQVAKHLLTQNKQSWRTNGIGCVYRNPDGLKCAVGCLIADDEYDVLMDGAEDTSVRDLVNAGLFPDAHTALLSRLQSVHDYATPENWSSELRIAANKFGLKFTPPSTDG